MGAIERAEQIVEILRLDAGRHPIERRLRHALLQHLVDAERRDDFFETRDRHLQFAVDASAGVDAECAGRDRNQFTLLNARLHDLDMTAGGG